MDLFYCLNQVSLKLPSTQVLPLGNLHARATPVPQAVLEGGCILQNSCGHSGGRKGRRTRGLQDSKQVTPYPPLILISATFAQVVQMYPWKEMPLQGMKPGREKKKKRRKSVLQKAKPSLKHPFSCWNGRLNMQTLHLTTYTKAYDLHTVPPV